MNNEIDIILTLVLIGFAVAAIAAYLCRDKSQDEIKQQRFIESITGTGLFDKSSKSK